MSTFYQSIARLEAPPRKHARGYSGTDSWLYQNAVRWLQNQGRVVLRYHWTPEDALEILARSPDSREVVWSFTMRRGAAEGRVIWRSE